MKKFFIQLSVLCLIIFGAIYVTFNRDLVGPFLPSINGDSGITSTASIRSLKVGSSIIEVEVADTASKRASGLSNRESLKEGTGMLFIFPEEKKHRFWMKGMKFNLDFIFIRDGKVVDLLAGVPKPEDGAKDQDLPLYEPITETDMLLEVNSGYIQKSGIKVGDSVNLVK